jgi:DNA-binding transcriptional regulator YiaG
LPNHPNRSKGNISAAANPTPAQVRRAREDAGLTLEQAAALVHATWRSWQNWEADASSDGHRRMHPSTWELFQVKVAAARGPEEGQDRAGGSARDRPAAAPLRLKAKNAPIRLRPDRGVALFFFAFFFLDFGPFLASFSST